MGLQLMLIIYLIYIGSKKKGVSNKYKIIDYAHGIAPGVFVIVTSSLPQVHHEMKFLKMTVQIMSCIDLII